MLLHSLLHQYDPALSPVGVPNSEIRGIRDDSRNIESGDLFIARPGSKTDGARFLADAKARGAVAAVTFEKIAASPLPQIVIPDPAVAGILANLFRGRPSLKMPVLGITGTNGKTTTTYLIRHLLKTATQRCGLIGTIEIDDGKTVTPAHMTTPGPIELADLLGRMRDKGCRACAMEVSSHALDQGRIAGVHFSGAGFTNLSGDHLDYHGTMENYAAAKAKLFAELDPAAVAVVNAEDKYCDRMIQDCSARLIRYTVGNGKGSRNADYRARDISIASTGTTFTLQSPDGKANVSMKLIGRHNIENALCAAALVGETMNLSVNQIAQGLADAPGAPGRLQPVHCGQAFAVLVDYAHTDDALENVLSALRPLCRGKLRVLFGCGGDRDRTKRPRMARTANKLADCVYLTSDNPRTEDPAAILREVAAGLPASNRCSLIEPDRRTAIEAVLRDAKDEDVVLIAGKGHEDYQIIGETRYHFDDVEECERVLRGRVASAA